MGLRVQLGQVPGPPHQQVQPAPQQVHRKFESLARQRRRARRAAAKAENTEAVEAAEGEKETTEDVDETITEVAEMHEETFDEQVCEIAAEATVVGKLSDEVCSDEEYTLKNKILNEGIPQVDGTFDVEVLYTFVSDFHKEDIEYTIQELIPAEEFETKLASVVRIGGLQSADQLCKLVIKMPPDQNFIWPRMSISQSEVIKDLKAVPHFDPA